MRRNRNGTFMERAATFIVDKKNIFFLAFIVAAIFSIFSSGWVNINDDLTEYLDPDTETRKGLDIMDAEFIEYASAKVMVANISYERAQVLLEEVEAIEGVHSVEFDDSETHYKNACALLTVTLDGTTSDAISVKAMENIREQLADYDLYVSTEVGNPLETIIGEEMKVVLLIAIIIIIAVLLFTSQTYMEIPVLLITFIAAALLNMGTNFLFGTISYITNSIAVVLQLALAIDYAIIFCHRYTEERKTQPAREAVITALTKAIPEISASSLTTISGLTALTLMHFRLGYDMGIVLIKAIVMSMLSVFLLMPGLLLLFSKLIDRTPHRSFVPKINAWGKLVVKTRYIIPPIFLVIVVCAFFFSSNCPYVYGYSTLDTVKQNDNKIASKLITETFGSENFVALVVPSGNYENEAALLDELETYAEVESAMGLANTEAMDGYTLTSSLTPRQFAEITDQDIETVRMLYTGFAVREADYGQIVADIDQYSVPLIDMFLYLYDQKEEGYVTLDREMDEEIDDLYTLLTFAQVQLEGEHWSRFVIYLNLPEESEETFEFLDTMHAVSGKYYDEAYLVGMSVNERDLQASFSEDNLLISILSALFVIVVLIITFRSVGLPVLLIIVIQSSIWINFSVPYLTDNNLFFIAYLIVSAIQMGANIDYAIVISNRYIALKSEMPIKKAIVQALNQSFPTVITSGTMLASAGFIIGQMTSDNTISSIGTCLGRGTLISIFLVMGVLPQILLLGDLLIEKTQFKKRKPELTRIDGSVIKVNGRVRGHISGYIDAEVYGVFQGSLEAVVQSGVAIDEDSFDSPPAAEHAQDSEEAECHAK